MKIKKLIFAQDSTGGQAAELRHELSLLNTGEEKDAIFAQLVILEDEEDGLQTVSVAYKHIPYLYAKRIQAIIKELCDEQKRQRDS